MIIVEFAGTFRSGKSTLIRHLNKDLWQRGYNVQTIGKDRKVGERFIDKNAVLARQKWVITGMIKELYELKDMSRADILLVHRGPWDAIAFLYALIESGLVQEKDAPHYIDISVEETSLIDLVVLFQTPAKISLARLGWKPFEKEIDPVVNEEVANHMEIAYQKIASLIPAGKHLSIHGTNALEENYKIINAKINRLLQT